MSAFQERRKLVPGAIGVLEERILFLQNKSEKTKRCPAGRTGTEEIRNSGAYERRKMKL